MAKLPTQFEETLEGTVVWDLPFPVLLDADGLAMLKGMRPLRVRHPYHVEYLHSYGQDSPFFAGLTNDPAEPERGGLMRTAAALSTCVLALGAASWVRVASADEIAASCEVLLEGEKKKRASGPCSFSQRQGYIYIDLKNGGTWELSPDSKHDHFKDQKGNKVVRAKSGDGREVFEWEDGRKIIVKLP